VYPCAANPPATQQFDDIGSITGQAALAAGHQNNILPMSFSVINDCIK
jgi:hypothetical protein